MPPVSQQGSRAGLITALIISIILFMVSTIMWIYTNTESTKLRVENTSLKGKYEKIARNDELTDGADVALVDAAKEKLALPGNFTTVEVALAQINKLAEDINGAKNANTYADADTGAAVAAKMALDVLKNPAVLPAAPTTKPTGSNAGGDVAMPGGETLIGLLGKLGVALNQATQTNGKQTKDLAAVKGDLDTKVKAWNDQYAELNAKVAEADKKVSEAQKALADAQAQYTTKQTATDDGNKKLVEEQGKQVQDATTELAKAKAELGKAQAKINELVAYIARYRQDVKDAAVRQADGTIIRVPSSNVCYISLGMGDHLPVGTTFEVYDKVEGIPGLGPDPQSNNNLPVGKGSIEVVRVGQNSSECRIVHMQPGMTLTEGDLIANLVYDRNTTFNFFVYGNFDVDGNGIWTPQEGDVVKSLVTRWGGKVVDKISIGTDFAVFGQEPVVPAFTKEEIEDPLNKAKLDKAIADLKGFQDRILEAATLHIPIMNQNRFMYYIGYYDQMKR